MTAPPSMTFDETFPTTVRFGNQVTYGLGMLWLASFLIVLFTGGTGFIRIVFNFVSYVWLAYFAYRFLKRYKTTVFASNGVITIVRKSVIPFMGHPPTCFEIGSRPTVELGSSANWWTPKSIPFMPGDRPQDFSDLAVSRVDAGGKMVRVLISRDRRSAEALMQRREELRQLLGAARPPEPERPATEMGFSL